MLLNKKHWIGSPGWDCFWVFGGLWITSFYFLFSVFGAGESLTVFVFTVGPILWFMHTIMPSAIVYTSPVIRGTGPLSVQRYLFWPALIAVGCFALGIAGFVAHHLEALILATWIYHVANTWHFSAQNFGVLSIYRKKAEQASERRRWDRAYTIWVGCVLQPVAWYLGATRLGYLTDFFPRAHHYDFLKPWLTAVTAATFLAYAYQEWQQPNRSLPKIIYAFGIALQPVLSALAYYPLGFMIFSIPHYLVEIGFASRVHLNFAAKQKLIGFVACFLGLFTVFYYLSEMPIMRNWTAISRVDFSLIPPGIDEIYLGIAFGLLLFLKLMHFFLHRYVYNGQYAEGRAMLVALVAAKQTE